MRGKSLDISIEDLNSFEEDRTIGNELDMSHYFRKQCIDAGFKLLELYPCYYQGWEMDEWGAIGIKNGKKYILETNHGGLYPELASKVKYKKVTCLERK